MKTSVKDLNPIISDFVSSLDNRSDIFLVYNPIVIEKLLYWHKVSWQNWLSLTDESNSGTDWFMIYREVNEGVKKIGKRSIAARQYSFTVSFLKNFEKHLNENKEVMVKNKNGKIWLYRNYAYAVFFELLIEFVLSETNEEDYMWKEFPSDWKVTASNLKDKKVFALLSYGEFIDWAMPRIQRYGKEEFDKTLHSMVENLFPEIDAKTLEIILLFICSPFDPEARVKSVIQRYWAIGQFSLKATSFSFVTSIQEGTSEEDITKQMLAKQTELEEEIKVAIRKTYELAILLFSEVFSKNNLAKYVEEAKRLEYPPDTKEEDKREELLRIFTGLTEN